MPQTTSPSPLTTAQIAERYRVPGWLVRRIVDALPVAVPRFNRCRAVPPDLLSQVEAELRRRGYLPQEEVAPNA